MEGAGAGRLGCRQEHSHEHCRLARMRRPQPWRKRPKDYVFLNALPKKNYGKILKTELRELDKRRLTRPASRMATEAI